MSAEEVAKFYNNLHNQDVEDRQSSRIIYLRGFNNWIKSVLIRKLFSYMDFMFNVVYYCLLYCRGRKSSG